ncbi:MAG: hypothetical protein IMW89_05025 [Ktedonobacteraceae bacterium]|nr:hypothetical protein [Ktedonobacteraceae bacterium]
MQKATIKNRTTDELEKQGQERDTILHFSLQGALPEGHVLALNTIFGTLSYIACEDNQPRLLMQEQFTGTEMSVVLPMLEMFPYYCPYEVMYASFFNGRVTEKIVERCRRRLQEAQEEGVWDQEMRPVRGALSRARLKLRPFGIDVSSILATGYILMISDMRGIGREREQEQELVVSSRMA